jgi:hypothetical protein
MIHSSDDKNGNTVGLAAVVLVLKSRDLVKKEVLYNILVEFGAPIELFGLIKMCVA